MPDNDDILDDSETTSADEFVTKDGQTYTLDDLDETEMDAARELRSGPLPNLIGVFQIDVNGIEPVKATPRRKGDGMVHIAHINAELVEVVKFLGHKAGDPEAEDCIGRDAQITLFGDTTKPEQIVGRIKAVLKDGGFVTDGLKFKDVREGCAGHKFVAPFLRRTITTGGGDKLTVSRIDLDKVKPYSG